MQDLQGRLWLDYCGLERLINGISVFQFDGYDFHPVEFFSLEKGRLERLTIMGMSAQGQLFGQAEEKELTLDYPNGLWGSGHDFPLLINEEEAWFMGGTLPLFRLNRKVNPSAPIILLTSSGMT